MAQTAISIAHATSTWLASPMRTASPQRPSMASDATIAPTRRSPQTEPITSVVASHGAEPGCPTRGEVRSDGGRVRQGAPAARAPRSVSSTVATWSGRPGSASPIFERSGARPRRALYRIASITKTFTATAIMQLRDAGKLDLDDRAVAYLPELGAASGSHRAADDQTNALARVGAPERAARNRLDAGPVRKRPGTDARARR